MPTRLLAAFAVLISLGTGAGSASAADGQLPNVVVLYADDMGFGDLGIQNPDSKIPTPHLDRLAREGTRFTNAHSSSGICTPSRYALLTGRYHWRKLHGIVQSFGPPVIDDARLTLPEMLREKGYHTACIGKWHLGWDWDAIKRPGATAQKTKGARKPAYAPDDFDWSQPVPGGPLAHGFDEYFGDDVPNFPPYAWFENDRVLGPPTVALHASPPTAEGNWEARPGPMVDGWSLDTVMPTLTERAVSWINDRDSAKPFFLYFPFTSPHAPIVPTDDFQGASQAGGYGDFVTQTDNTVGRVLQALADNGLTENTIVVFTSDNGPEKYAFERARRFDHRSTAELRGLKRDIWEGGHRVPTIVRWPGQVPAGRVSDALLSQIDLMATLADIVDYDLPADAADDSHSQLSLLRGGASSARESLVHNTRQSHYAVRQGDWVLIDAPTGTITPVPKWFAAAEGYTPTTTPALLFNLREDPGQRVDRSAEEPTRVAEMRALLTRTRAAGEVRGAN